MSKQTIYWGVLCRKCSAAVAFGSPSHRQFELGNAYSHPGTIHCANGHSAIYFPRDFKFFPSDEDISDDTMRGNREAHRAINPVALASSDRQYGTRWAPPMEKQPAPRVVPVVATITLAEARSDPRRETAQAASKGWWADWAAKKVS
jgi:hypothetical protein